jgi:ATP-dependent RNA helicase RhlE
MTNPTQGGTPTFYGLGIAPNLLNVLEKIKYTTPTPIQMKAIPPGIEGKDLVGIAQTGTGKTLAFSIPMLQRISATKGKGLVLLPTRELALQVEETLQKVGKTFGLRTAVLIGGASMGKQISDVRKNPHVIVATPGRLIDHLEQKTVTLSKVSVLVLDEADRMLDMGFAPQLKRILDVVPKDRQTLLFSATMPEAISRIAASYMKLPIRVEIARAGTAAESVAQELFVVRKEDKIRLLEKILAEYRGTVLVFSRTKHGAKKIARSVKTMGHRAAEIHSNRSLSQRREALDGFKNGKYRVLVATDIAARGIDVTGIELVVNFDLPDQAEDYVHRIGRTGRAGLAGKAISFATPDQGADVRAIERLVRIRLPALTPKELPPARKPGPNDAAEDRDGRPPRRHGYDDEYRRARPARSHAASPTRSASPASPSPSHARPPHRAGSAPRRGPSGSRSGGGGSKRPPRGPRRFYGGPGV